MAAVRAAVAHGNGEGRAGAWGVAIAVLRGPGAARVVDPTPTAGRATRDGRRDPRAPARPSPLPSTHRADSARTLAHSRIGATSNRVVRMRLRRPRRGVRRFA